MMDQRTIQILFVLLRSAIFGTKLTDDERGIYSEEMLQDILEISAKHDVIHLLVLGLKQNALIPKGDVEIDKYILIAVYRYERLRYEYDNLCAVLEKAQIPFLPLKGSVIRHLYPEPWMRTSCDIDILVHEDDIDFAIKIISEKLSYVAESKGSHDVDLFSNTGVHLELHYRLNEEMYVGKAENILQSVWENATPFADSSKYVLSDEMFYYYHIAHMAKHFVNGGCGIRPFIDIWMLNHRSFFDKGKRNKLLERGGLLMFARKVEELSDVWFGKCNHTENTYRMQEYLLAGGVYGTTANRVFMQQVRRGGKVRYALSRIWIPYRSLKFYYPSLVGKRILLPFFEVRRWCRLIFCDGVKRSINELKINSFTTSDEQTKAKDMLLMLDLDQQNRSKR